MAKVLSKRRKPKTRERKCDDCGETFSINKRQTLKQFCSLRYQARLNERTVNLKKCRGTFKLGIHYRSVVHRLGRKCYLCGKKIEGRVIVSHKILLADGGDHTWENVGPAHKSCSVRNR